VGPRAGLDAVVKVVCVKLELIVLRFNNSCEVVMDHTYFLN
jgi:hypothetical protein